MHSPDETLCIHLDVPLGPPWRNGNDSRLDTNCGSVTELYADALQGLQRQVKSSSVFFMVTPTDLAHFYKVAEADLSRGLSEHNCNTVSSVIIGVAIWCSVGLEV